MSKKKNTHIDGHSVFEVQCPDCKKNSKTNSSRPIPDDGHLVSSAMVVLALVAYVTDKDGTQKCIPVTLNPFRNSHFGIKPLNYKVCFIANYLGYIFVSKLSS